MATSDCGKRTAASAVPTALATGAQALERELADVRGEFQDDTHPAPREDATSPLHRLRDHRGYWRRTMAKMGSVCAFTLSILASGYKLEWDPAKGPAAPAYLRNHPSAQSNSIFVSEAVQAGVDSGIIRQCSRADLRCILPLAVAVNHALKKRLIWDGRHVNANLIEVPFKMETLQREGRTLFSGCSWGGTFDISSAYHHVDMHKDSLPYLGFEWAGSFFGFVVLPFGLSTAPRIFTKVMHTSVSYLRWKGCKLLAYLDDLPFAQNTAEASLRQARLMLRVLRKFGWLVHPTKCVGLSEAAQIFAALGTLIDLVSQTYKVTEGTICRIVSKARALMCGPRSVPARTLASFKGLVSSTWVATGSPTLIRTRAMDAVVGTRPVGASRRELRRSYDAAVTLTPAALDEIRWWATNIGRVSGQPIQPRPLQGPLDSTIYSDASDTGYGAVIVVEGHPDAPSSFCDALVARAPPGTTAAAVRRYARRGVEVMGALPPHLLSASSTLREMHGLGTVIMSVGHLLTGGRHLTVLDNLGCVFILGGVVPPAAVGNKQWGEWVSGGSPNPDLQRWALQICDAEVRHGFKLVVTWRPRAENVRADWLSHTSEMCHHDYSVKASAFLHIDQRWGPHSIDRFATLDNVQPLAPPNSGRYCSQFFEAKAEWVDAFSVSWHGENNWCHPPHPMVGRAIKHLLACRATGTLLVSSNEVAAWWPLLYPWGAGRPPAPYVTDSLLLGLPKRALAAPLDPRYGHLRGAPVIAFRINGRLA